MYNLRKEFSSGKKKVVAVDGNAFVRFSCVFIYFFFTKINIIDANKLIFMQFMFSCNLCNWRC